MYRSKRKWIIRILLCLTVVIAVLGVCYYVAATYTIKTVYVEGNYHYTQEEIQSFVMDGALGNNSLYLSMKYKNRGVENIPFVDVMDVKVLAPDTIKITVYEKALAGYVKHLNTYMYFDKDGYVVENSSVKTMGVPQITGLKFDYAVLGKPLPVEDPEVFNDILNITKLLNKYELLADKIQFQGTKEITVFFGDLRVELGDESGHLEDKIMLLPRFLEDLSGKKGTLQMKVFDEKKGKYTFQPENL
ncbi:MAG: FtsQ-type POTRA domain-containing protein [Roseburia sp.]|nr:FtsQ-type POTRA domain-containing protein [Roseburia sp.]